MKEKELAEKKRITAEQEKADAAIADADLRERAESERRLRAAHEAHRDSDYVTGGGGFDDFSKGH